MGYENAQLYISQIKERLQRECSQKERDSMRLEFRSRINPLTFSSTPQITGNLTPREKKFIVESIGRKDSIRLTLPQLKRSYYAVASSGLVNTFFPSYKLPQNGDTALTVLFHTTKSTPLRIMVGGNLSTSSLNQFYAGVSYSHLSGRPWIVKGSINLGKF